MNSTNSTYSKDWYQENGYTLITPEIATQWLAKNTRNRHIRERAVAELVRKIKNGQWQPNTLDAIGFYEDGTLANGQHRLTAIAKAGLPVYAKVEYNVPMEAAVCIDSGKSRTANDAVMIVTGESYYTAKISKMVRTISSSGHNLTHEDHVKISTKYREPLIKVKDMFEGLPKHLQATSIMASVFTALMNGVDEEKLRRFVKVLSTSYAQSDAEVSIVAFKNRLDAENNLRNSKQRRDYIYEVKRCQNVIYNFVKGKAISKFAAPDSYRYPLIKFDLT